MHPSEGTLALPPTDLFQRCPHCGSAHQVSMVNDWQQNDGPIIPLVACGNPWHYGLGSEQWKWLESTKTLQEDYYHYDFPFPSAHELAPYIEWNIFATYQELAEAAVEFSWKPWATDEVFVNRERVRDELIDAMHFIGNILVGMGVTDKELEEAYQAKQEKNRRRAASGTYSAKKGSLGEGSDAE